MEKQLSGESVISAFIKRILPRIVLWMGGIVTPLTVWWYHDTMESGTGEAIVMGIVFALLVCLGLLIAGVFLCLPFGFLLEALVRAIHLVRSSNRERENVTLFWMALGKSILSMCFILGVFVYLSEFEIGKDLISSKNFFSKALGIIGVFMAVGICLYEIFEEFSSGFGTWLYRKIFK